MKRDTVCAMVNTEPFSFGSGTRGVLLVHGFTGTPFEMRLLGEELAEHGYAVEGPRLAGHCGTTRDLARTTWHDWYRSADDAFTRLRARVGSDGKMAVCGLSMGGLLALELARQHAGELGALGVLSAPLWLAPEAEALIALTARTPLVRKLALPKIAGSDIRDPEMKRQNNIAQGRSGMPLPALRSLAELGARLRDDDAALLRQVQVPTLLAHAERDHTVPFACMDAIAHRLGAPVARKLILRESFHVITLDVERAKVFAAVVEHLERFLN
jgi:carboxylesterase